MYNKSVSKLTEDKGKKNGLLCEPLNILEDRVIDSGGLSLLSFDKLRTFTLIVLCYHTLFIHSGVRILYNSLNLSMKEFLKQN